MTGDGRMIFVVSRQGESGPLLLIGAVDEEDAIAKVLEQEKIGTFFEHGYYDSNEIGTRYVASPATTDDFVPVLAALKAIKQGLRRWSV